MATLFPLDVNGRKIPSIQGLGYLPEYIPVDEEAELAQRIDLEPWETSRERRRQLYGANYGPGAGTKRPIPDWGRALAEPMHREGLSEGPFDQLLVEYEPGQGIALHHDHKPFDRTIVFAVVNCHGFSQSSRW